MNTQYNTAPSLTSSNVQLNAGPPRPQRQRTPATDGCLNSAVFEQFLCWLDPDEEAAGRKYESIRGRLIMMFKARRCIFAEDLADATIERVAQKMNYLSIGFSGDPALYFYGVAKKIYLEYQRKIMTDHKRAESPRLVDTGDPDLESLLEQLDEALSAIPRFDRELVLRYYSGVGKTKINHRRALARQFGMAPNALRLRVFRIRKAIKNYMLRSGGNALMAHESS
jgi:DNA-directed RNA polymerase specialized sigma24 family protein